MKKDFILLLMAISGILQDNQCCWCVVKTTHGSYSTKIGEFGELKTKSSELWFLRSSCEVKQCDQNIMTEHKKNAEHLHGTGITVRRNTDTDKETIYFGIMLTIVL